MNVNEFRMDSQSSRWPTVHDDRVTKFLVLASPAVGAVGAVGAA